MGETMLTLKPGVIRLEQAGQTGLMLHGHIQFAKDLGQAEILRALVERPQPLESLMACLHERDGPAGNEHDISLAIAMFVLDFGEYLQG